MMIALLRHPRNRILVQQTYPTICIVLNVLLNTEPILPNTILLHNKLHGPYFLLHLFQDLMRRWRIAVHVHFQIWNVRVTSVISSCRCPSIILCGWDNSSWYVVGPAHCRSIAFCGHAIVSPNFICHSIKRNQNQKWPTDILESFS